MTATATRLTTPRRRTASTALRLVLVSARSALLAIAHAWTGFVEAGQLGPSAETSVSRHSGARI